MTLTDFTQPINTTTQKQLNNIAPQDASCYILLEITIA